MSGLEAAYRRARRITLVGICVSVVLAATNLIVGSVANSTAVTATGFEFAGDVLASTLVLVAMGVAARPADDNHPYGHGRFETISAFLVGLILAVAGAGISYQSVLAVGETHSPPGPAAVVALLVAIGLRSVMFALKFRTGRQLRSSALVADAWNDAVDILSAAAALAAVLLATTSPERFLAADHWGGFVVGLVVVYTGIRVARDASFELADTMPSADLTDEVAGVARQVPGVLGTDKLMARKTGLRYHIDLHVEVDPAISVAEAHAIGGQVRSTLRERLPWVADVLIHVEPAGPEHGG